MIHFYYKSNQIYELVSSKIKALMRLTSDVTPHPNMITNGCNHDDKTSCSRLATNPLKKARKRKPIKSNASATSNSCSIRVRSR